MYEIFVPVWILIGATVFFCVLASGNKKDKFPKDAVPN